MHYKASMDLQFCLSEEQFPNDDSYYVYHTIHLTKLIARILILLCLLFACEFICAQQRSLRTILSVDAEIACICGEKEASYPERIRLIHHLPSNLTREQLECCWAFLESPFFGQQLSDLEFNGLKNELVFALLRQREGLPELVQLLVRMACASETDGTWRDYCVQFLGKCYPCITDSKSREAMADTLWKVLNARRNSRVAGSAARQLMMLSRAFPEVPPDKVAAMSFEALRDPRCSDESKTALLQVCGMLGEHEALPIARAIATQHGAPVLRASAIAAIGMLGDASDFPLLQRLSSSGDTRVSHPASVAIERIQSR